jgi:hypothetical protein
MKKYLTREEALAHAEGCPCKECGDECAQIIQQLKEADAEYPGNPLLTNAARKLTELNSRLKHLVVAEAGLPLYDEIERLKVRLREAKDDVKCYQIFISHFFAWYPRIAQLLDGWHQDGTAWTEWDTSVRNELRDLGMAAEMFRAATAAAELSKQEPVAPIQHRAMKEKS